MKIHVMMMVSVWLLSLFGPAAVFAETFPPATALPAAPSSVAIPADVASSVPDRAKPFAEPAAIAAVNAALPSGWGSQDVGAVGVPGTSSFSAGIFTISGSGVDIWDRADSFHYAYRTLTGDGEIVARVASQQKTNGWAKAGVMLRNSLTANSPHVLMAITPENGAAFQRRRSVGAGTAQTAGPRTAKAPYWVKLVRKGRIFSGYVSLDGLTWTFVGRDTIYMNTTLYVGLAVTSHDNTTLCTSAMDNVVINGTPVSNLPSVSITAPTSGATYAAPATVEITAQAAAYAGATVSMVEFYNGTTRLGAATSAPYSYTWSNIAAGSYTVNARVTDSLGGTAASAPVTITIVSPPTVSITAPASGTIFAAPATIDITVSAAAGTGATLQRVEFYNGSTLLGQATTSPYGYRWNNVSAGAYTLTAKAVNSLGTATTSAPVTVEVANPPTVAITSPPDGASFTAPAAIVITASAMADAGAAISRVEFYSGEVLLGEATSAPYSFTWNSETAGTYTLTAKAIDSRGFTATSPPIAVSVTGPPTVSITSPAGGTAYTSPATVVITATATPGIGATISKVEFYNGIDLVGEAVAEPYSYTWRGVAAGNYSLSAKVITNVGTSVMSSPVEIRVMNSILPAPWVTQDIGSVRIAGTATYLNGTFAMGSSGSDIWYTADSFRYVHQQLVGDGEIIARVATLDNTSPWAKGGLMIRESLAADSPHALMAITPGNGAAFQRRLITGGNSTNTAGPLVTAPYWVKLVRSGDTFSGYVSPDGTNWQLVGSDTIVMAGTVHVGLTLTSNSVNVLCSATFDNLSLAGNLPGNLTVTLTKPGNGASFVAPAAIPMTAWPAPSLGAQIDRVEFFNGDTLIGESAAVTDPYSFTWSNVPSGIYSLTARMTDSAGLTATSEPVTISVTDATLPGAWRTSDVGNIGIAGNAGYLNGTFSLHGSGTDIWNAADGFRFVYQPMAGDGHITARIAYQENTDPWAKTGVMIRGTLDANSPHAFMAVTPGNGAAFQRRLTARAASLSTAGPKVSAPYWVRLVRSGNIISGYVSPDGLTWELVGSDTVAMATSVYVGLPLTSKQNTLLGSATIDAVDVTSVPLPLPPLAGPAILEEGFDDNQLKTRGWFDGGATAPVIVSDPEMGNVMEITYPAGAITPNNGGAMRRMFPAADDMIISFRIKYQNDWKWPTSGYGPHEFYLLTNVEPDIWTGMAYTFLTTYLEGVNGKPSIVFQDAKNIDQNNIGVPLAGVTENRGVMGCNGSSDQYPDGICYGNTGEKINGKTWTEPILPPLNNASWRSVKVRLKMNSVVNGIGLPDGILQYWLDDVPYIYHPDVLIRTGQHPDARWNELIIAPYFSGGSPQLQKFWIEDLKITTVLPPGQAVPPKQVVP